MENFVQRIFEFYQRRPIAVGGFFLILLAVAVYLLSGLKIHTSQLDLLPADLPPVIDARRIDKLAGGAGYLVLTLRSTRPDPADEKIARAARLRLAGRDAEAEALIEAANSSYRSRRPELRRAAVELKNAADRLAEKLSDSPRVRYVRYRRNHDFFKKKALYFWETKDLREALRRLAIKRDELIARADPFYIELERKPYRLDLSDLIARYSRVGGRRLEDDYMLSPDQKMAMLLIKPTFPLDDIQLARSFLEEARGIVARELQTAPIAAGFTGTYAYYVEAFESVSASLRPAMLAAFMGIALVLFLFLRRPVLVVILLISLVYAVALTFGVTALLIGRLNLFTALFGGVLAGLGVDFGIHLIHRYLEESAGRPPVRALAESILTTGRAVIFSAATTAAAFGVLIFTEFAGFRELGMIATIGILLTVLTMFLLTPYLMLVYLRFRPGAWRPVASGNGENFAAESADGSRSRRVFSRLARVVLISAAPAFALMLLFAMRAGFDHDARNMLETDLESVRLNKEVDIRFSISGDPLVVISSSLGEAQAVREFLERQMKTGHALVSRVVSVFQFVPEPARQRRNYRLLQNFARESGGLNPAVLGPEMRRRYGRYLNMLGEKPYGVEDLPEEILREFRALPESAERAWLTFVYPDRNRMYLTTDLMELDRLLGEFQYALIPSTSLDLLRGSSAGDSKSDPDDEADLLRRINSVDPAEMSRLGIYPDIIKVIDEHRPFESLKAVRSLRKTARATGSAVLMARFIDMIQAELAFILTGTIVLIVFFLFLSFRRPAAILLCLVPLAAGTLATAACLGAFDLRVNFFSVAVFPVIIGYGIDNGIFLYHRFRENGSARLTLFCTAPAILAAGSTTLVGWGTLALAIHPGIRSMGTLACIGIACLVLVSLVLFPAILQIVEERIDRRRASAGT